MIIGAGLFDMVDGRVARETNQVTKFGGFFDSVLDRYSDLGPFRAIRRDALTRLDVAKSTRLQMRGLITMGIAIRF